LHATPLQPTFIPPFPTGIRSFLKFIFSLKSREIYKNLKIDKIIFPGGGLLAIKLRAYIIWGITFWWLRKYFPNAEIIFEHQGVDKTSCLLKKAIIKHVFKHSNKISVRDEISRGFLQNLHIEAVEDGDRVEKYLANSAEFKLPNVQTPEFRKTLVLINACRENSAKFSDLCTPENLPHGTAAAFICFDPSDAKYVPQGFKGQIIFPDTVEETFKLFQRAKMAIGQRLHFLILANHFCGAENTFTLEKPYSQKVKNFAEKYKIKEK
jgi:polysaccharide pyruvyl transferase WcaK-like protein